MLGYFVHGQLSGDFFYKKYPYCSIQPQDIIMMRDGICDGGVMNTIGEFHSTFNLSCIVSFAITF